MRIKTRPINGRAITIITSLVCVCVCVCWCVCVLVCVPYVDARDSGVCVTCRVCMGEWVGVTYVCERVGVCHVCVYEMCMRELVCVMHVYESVPSS